MARLLSWNHHFGVPTWFSVFFTRIPCLPPSACLLSSGSRHRCAAFRRAVGLRFPSCGVPVSPTAHHRASVPRRLSVLPAHTKILPIVPERVGGVGSVSNFSAITILTDYLGGNRPIVTDRVEGSPLVKAIDIALLHDDCPKVCHRDTWEGAQWAKHKTTSACRVRNVITTSEGIGDTRVCRDILYN
jgi:hypothetical protein